MDPYSDTGELVNIHTAFIQGQYSSVLNDFSPSIFSSDFRLPAQILQHRASCCLGDYASVLKTITASDASSSPDLAAVRLYASYLSALASSKAADSVVASAEELATSQGDNLHVQLLVGTVLARAGKTEQAVSLLQKHQGSLDAVALLVQIHLASNRTDLAVKEAKSARSFAQDALLVNLAESWIGVRQGGDNYQKAFYVFEELAQGPSTASVTSLVAQAVSELHMGRIEEAETALDQALSLEPENVAALANKLVLDTIAGKGTSEDIEKQLRKADQENEILREIDAKREAFKVAASKYNPKFEA